MPINIFPFTTPSFPPSEEDIGLAAQLRALADDIESGQIHEVVVTVIRKDGQIERLGAVPEVTRPR